MPGTHYGKPKKKNASMMRRNSKKYGKKK